MPPAPDRVPPATGGATSVRLMVAPYDAGRRGYRMGAGPERLLVAGLEDSLASTGRDVELMAIEPDVDDVSSELRRGFGLQRRLRTATAEALAEGRFPLLLAGDCNSSLGVVAGLQAHGMGPAFLWCNAHADFHTPETDAFGSLDSQGLSMLTGRSWRALVDETGLASLPDDRVVLVAARAVDHAEEIALGRSGIRWLSVEQVRDPRARDEATSALGAGGADVTHLHVDADVLDPSLAPANDYAAPGGLFPDDLVTLAESPSMPPLRSMSVASYDPRLDPEGVLASALVDVVTRVIAGGDPG